MLTYIAIFDKVAATLAKIERRLTDERLDRHRLNPFIALFSDPREQSDIANFCKALSESVTDDQFLSRLAFTSEHEQRISELTIDIQNKRSLDIPAKSAQLASEVAALDAARISLQQHADRLSLASAKAINQTVARIDEQKRIVQGLSTQNFDDGLFATIGSPEWKALLRAARAFYGMEQRAEGAHDPTHCALCHQTLQPEQQALFQKYWKLLESEAETELRHLEERLATTLADLRTARARFPSFSADDTATRILGSSQPELLAALREQFSALGRKLDDWTTALAEQKPVNDAQASAVDLGKLDTLAREKERERAALIDPASDIAVLFQQLTALEHRRKASALLQQGLDYLTYRRWQAKINTVSFAGIKAATTKKRTEAFLAGVVVEYKTVFNDELAALGCDFNLVLSASGDQGSTVKEYYLEFSEEHRPTRVLSEGEQNVCSLADFLTEIQLDANNCGIFLDDPVSSLDHERKGRIAARLVREAARRQVTIFTHDISFMRKLVDAAREQEIPFVSHWIQKSGGVPGHITLESSPKLASAAALKADAQAAVNECTTLEPKQQEAAVNTAASSLRSACEALIEELLFAKTIQRYDDQIRVQNLEEAVLDQPIAQRVVELHGKLSELILAHNRTDEMREDGLTLSQFDGMLKLFNALETDLKNAHKAARSSRSKRNEDEKRARGGW